MITISGNLESQNTKEHEIFRQDLGYDYPEDLDLRPNSKLHNKIVTKILERAQASRRVMSRYKGRWQDIDEVLKIYMSPEAKDGKKGKTKSKDYADLIIPESYATMETILTYYMMSFIQNPIFNFEGTGPEDVVGAKLLTHVVDHQVKMARMGLNLHTAFRDDTAYGFGAVAPTWRRYYGKKPRLRQYGRVNEQGVFEVLRERRDVESNALLYEGNELENINPYLFLPDVSVPIHEPQKAGYTGWVEETTIENLLKIENDPESTIFNVRYLKEIDGRSQYTMTPKQSQRSIYHDTTDTGRNTDIVWMYVDLIPSEWELGDSDYPEKWLLAVGGDRVLLTAEKCDYAYEQNPVAVCATGFDGYSAMPVSKLSMTHDIQTLINFMYTSHVLNVRKALNDMFLIDPSIINYYDLINPEPGKVIRTRRASWGQNMLDNAFKQLEVTDITQNNVLEAEHLGQLMRRINAASDQMQGTLAPRTSRVSSQEAGSLVGASLNRFQKNSLLIDLQLMQPIGTMFVKNIQHYMEEDTYIKVSGDWPSQFVGDYVDENSRLFVSPLDLMVNYDVMPTNGQIPGSEDPQTWTQLFQIASQNPVIAGQLDWIKLFKHLGRNLGAKNVDDFIVKVAPDQQVQQLQQQGNITPSDG